LADTLHISRFISEEIGPGELQIVYGSPPVEEEWIIAPARKEAVVACLHHACFPPHRDRRLANDSLPAIACRF
jgi:hypothetical protein